MKKEEKNIEEVTTEALSKTNVNSRRELLISFAEYLKERDIVTIKKENIPVRVDLFLKRD